MERNEQAFWSEEEGTQLLMPEEPAPHYWEQERDSRELERQERLTWEREARRQEYAARQRVEEENLRMLQNNYGRSVPQPKKKSPLLWIIPTAVAVLAVVVAVIVICLMPSKSGWITEDGKTCYYSEGEAAAGWTELEGDRYFFGSDGVMATGWTELEGNRYYFGPDGVMQTQWAVFGGNQYFFGSDGIMRTGWQTMEGYRYYFGGEGIMRTGWHTIDGFTYFFGEDGRQLSK